MIESVAILCKTFLAPRAYISESIYHTVSHLLLQAGLYLSMPLYSQDLDIPGKNLIYIAKNINIAFFCIELNCSLSLKLTRYEWWHLKEFSSSYSSIENICPSLGKEGIKMLNWLSKLS